MQFLSSYESESIHRIQKSICLFDQIMSAKLSYQDTVQHPVGVQLAHVYVISS